MKREKFLEITANNEWMKRNINNLVRELDKVDGWSPEFLAKATLKAKKAAIRAEMNREEANGLPLFASIIRTNEKGEKERVYKQRALFDVGDYEQMMVYHHSKGQHHIDMVRKYRNEAHERLGKWIQMPLFDVADKTKKAAR